MKQNKLDCCVVRDLLPSYMEELTEPETSEQIEAHLAECDACSELERNMRTQLPAKPVPKKSLRFLKRARNNRIISALFAILIALLIVVLWYFRIFHYSNTEAGRLFAVQDYLTSGKIILTEETDEGHDSLEVYRIRKGTPIHIVSYAETENNLFITFMAEDDLHSYGIMELSRGINGRYRPLRVQYGIPSNTALVYQYAGLEDDTHILSDSYSGSVTVFAGFSCEDVDTIRIQYAFTQTHISNGETQKEETYIKTYHVTDNTFLWVWSREQLLSELDIDAYESDEYNINVSHKPILLDSDGNDITEQYQEENPIWLCISSDPPLDIIYMLMLSVIVIGILVSKRILKN